jgi:hypothetical protein
MRTQPTLNSPQVWSLLFIIAAGAAVLLALPPVLGALFSPGTSETAVDEKFAALMADHEDALATYQARFDGRSVFFPPPSPAPQAPVRVSTPKQPEPDQPVIETPVIPHTYTGPSIRALLGDTVWFHGGLRLAVGEEAEGVEVLSVDAPWSARVAYAGGEYDVSLFENATPFFHDPDAPLRAASPPGLIEAGSESDRGTEPLRMSEDSEGGPPPGRVVPKPPRRPPDVPPE